MQCNRGNVSVLFALMLPFVVAGTAFGVETTYWYYKRLALQAAADAAAFSAAFERRAGGDDDQVNSVATLGATENGFDAVQGTLHVNYLEQANGAAVEVVLADTAQRFFTAYFSRAPIQIQARATATYNTAATACVLALNPSRSRAATFSGSSLLQLTNCSVMSNSSASDAVKLQGSARLNTECVIAVGGVSAASGLTMTECSTPVTNAPPVADPFKDIPAPVASGACKTAPSGNGTYVIDPGYYCSGMNLKGEVEFQPGVYVIDGDVSVSATADLHGAGVLLYVTGNGHVTMNGSAKVNLSAATSGIYEGILFFGDRHTAGGDNKFNGSADSALTGAMYFASQNVIYQGNFSGLNGCLQVIGDTVEWTGNTNIASDCSAYGMTAIPAYNIVRLTA
ncbi:MAG: pilus assembly protein TadG-related protein [Hyphomonadaceae bacterium]|nr:pilus assembly protein TadG-related protein [Hyphomonadaceae bacterium]